MDVTLLSEHTDPNGYSNINNESVPDGVCSAAILINKKETKVEAFTAERVMRRTNKNGNGKQTPQVFFYKFDSFVGEGGGKK